MEVLRSRVHLAYLLFLFTYTYNFGVESQMDPLHILRHTHPVLHYLGLILGVDMPLRVWRSQLWPICGAVSEFAWRY
jgi:hypothetical protein